MGNKLCAPPSRRCCGSHITLAEGVSTIQQLHASYEYGDVLVSIRASMVEAPPSDAATQLRGCVDLASIAAEDAESRDVIRVCGGIDTVVAAIDRFKNDAVVVAEACRALREICRGNAKNQEYVGGGACVKLISALHNFPDDEGVQRPVLGALRTVVVPHLDAFLQNGGLDAVLGVMDRFPGNGPLGEGCCQLLHDIASSPPSRLRVVEGGGVENILRAMVGSPESLPVQKAACSALGALAFDEELSHRVMRSLVKEGGIERITIAMSNFRCPGKGGSGRRRRGQNGKTPKSSRALAAAAQGARGGGSGGEKDGTRKKRVQPTHEGMGEGEEGALCAPRAVDADITEGTEGYEEGEPNGRERGERGNTTTAYMVDDERNFEDLALGGYGLGPYGLDPAHRTPARDLIHFQKEACVALRYILRTEYEYIAIARKAGTIDLLEEAARRGIRPAVEHLERIRLAETYGPGPPSKNTAHVASRAAARATLSS
jgi:hypothetical protein